MKLLPRARPADAMSDIVKVIRTPIPHKLGILGVSAALTYLIGWVVIKSFTPPPVPRHTIITYIKSYAPGRTLAQVIAQQKIDAPKLAAAKAKAKAEQDKADADRRAQFQKAQQIMKQYGL